MTERIQPEEIGALLDGRVSEPRRAELLAVLATADEDFELFIDTAAVLREAEEEEAAEPEPLPVDTPAVSQEVIPIDRGRRWWKTPTARVLAAAAVLAALALVPVIRARLNARAWEDPSRMSVMASRFTRELPQGWEPAFGGTRRGGGTAASRGATARIGVLQVELAIAAAAADFDQASLLAGQIAAYLREIPGAGALVARYDAIAAAARSHDPRLADLVEDGSDHVVRFAKDVGTGDYLGLGAWTEAGRLAAKRQAAAFFRAPESRGAVDRAVGMGLSGEAAARLRSIVHDNAEIRDWTSLQRDLDTLQGELSR